MAHMVPYTTLGAFLGILKEDLLSRSPNPKPKAGSE